MAEGTDSFGRVELPTYNVPAGGPSQKAVRLVATRPPSSSIPHRQVLFLGVDVLALNGLLNVKAHKVRDHFPRGQWVRDTDDAVTLTTDQLRRCGWPDSYVRESIFISLSMLLFLFIRDKQPGKLGEILAATQPYQSIDEADVNHLAGLIAGLSDEQRDSLTQILSNDHDVHFPAQTSSSSSAYSRGNSLGSSEWPGLSSHRPRNDADVPARATVREVCSCWTNYSTHRVAVFAFVLLVNTLMNFSL
jgi:hypothetical protein